MGDWVKHPMVKQGGYIIKLYMLGCEFGNIGYIKTVLVNDRYMNIECNLVCFDTCQEAKL